METHIDLARSPTRSANRLAVYADQTAPIINYYKSAGLLKTISAVGEVSDIAARAIAALK